MGHVSIRNPLQAPKERSCGISTHHHPLVPQSGTDYHPKHHTGCISPPSGNYMWWRCRTYPQLRCFAACSGFHDIGPALRNQQLILEIMSVGAWLRRDAIASYVCSVSSYTAIIRNFVPPRKSSKFLTLRRFCRHNICIPNVQYYEFSAQQNLWCEILEF